MVWSQHAKLEEYLRLCIARANWEATHRRRDVVVPTLVVVGDADAGKKRLPKPSVVKVNVI